MSQVLRDYQLVAIDRIRQNLKLGVKAQVLQMSVGSGKTSVASAIAKGAVSKGNRFFFVVDSLELVDQAAARFMADGMEVGVIQADHYLTDYSKPVQVATIQTLRNRWPEMPPSLHPKVIILDECHVLHQAHIEIMSECKSKGIPIIGLSATPFRKGLGEHFEALVVGATTQSLTERGWLVPAVCYAPFIPNLKGVKTKSDGDWKEDALAEYMGTAKIVGDVIDNWFKLGENRQTIVFACNVAHSKLLAHEFNARGVVAAHIDGYDPDKESRSEKIKAFREGRIQVLCNVGVLTKGFDAPETGCLVIARPTKSLMLHIQILGRGLRTAGGKADCIVIDSAGNCLRNGLPTDELPQELDDGKSPKNLDRKVQDKKDPVPEACISCGYVSTRHKCPECNFAPEVRKDVEIRDGVLYPLTKTDNPKEKYSTEEVASLYGQLLWYANSKGYASGWAWHKCREIAGRAPKEKTKISPMWPSVDTLNMIKHLQIRAAKRREVA